MPMQGASDELFASAALALHQHCRPGRSRAGDEIVDRLHGRTSADDRIEAMRSGRELRTKRAILVHEATPLQRVVERQQHLVVLKGLREKLERTALRGG